MGLFNQFISAYFGGVAYVGMSFVILLMSTKSGKIVLKQDYVWINRALAALIIFAVVSFLGYEIFVEKKTTNQFFVFEFSADGFNILKNIPLWCAGILLLVRGSQDDDGVQKVFWIILVYNVIITLIALYEVPAFTKNLAAAIVTPNMQKYINMGAMGYDFTYAIAIITPIMLYVGYKEKNVFKFSFAILCCYFVYKCSFLIALIALAINFFILLLCKLAKGNIISKAIASSILLILPFAVVLKKQIGNFLIDLSQLVDSFQLSERFFQLSQMILYGDTSGDTLVRFDLYWKTFIAALMHPVFGTAVFELKAVSSGHSTLLDTWSLYGIFGLIPFVLMGYCAMRYSMSCTNDYNFKVVIIAAYITFFFIATFDPVLSGPQIIFSILWVIPIFVRSCADRFENESSI